MLGPGKKFIGFSRISFAKWNLEGSEWAATQRFWDKSPLVQQRCRQINEVKRIRKWVQLIQARGVSMKDSVANSRIDYSRPLNSILLQNAVLCADCDVVSDSPYDHCRVCGSRSLFNISRLLGGMLPNKRATLIDVANGSCSSTPVLKFPRSRRVAKSSGRARQPGDAMQSRLFK